MCETFSQFLQSHLDYQIQESINDKGILKAIFVTGIPGAGKSYTTNQLKGDIQPIIVNTDKAVEFISKKDGVESSAENWRSIFADRAKRITTERLKHAIDGMLPLFIDGTSNNASTIMNRMGILEACGYDVGMVFIDTSVEVAIERAKERAKKIGRHVDESFIRSVYEKSQANRAFFETRFNYFKSVGNNPGELDDTKILKIFNSVQSFFKQGNKSPIGKDHINELKATGWKYLSDLYDNKWVENKIGAWYANY